MSHETGLIPHERSPEGIVTLSLPPSPTKPRGGVVVLDSWLIGAIDRTLQQVAGSRPTGVILASASPRVWVAGADLAEIDGLDDSALDAYLKAGETCFRRLLDLRCPTVALIHGAVLGGGLELALHCDALAFVRTPAGGKPYLVGLPEASLGICPGWGGTVMLPARIDPTLALDRTASGTPWKSDALPAGLADLEADDAESLGGAAREWILARKGAPPPRPRAVGPASREVIEKAIAASSLAGAAAGTSAHAVLAAVRAGLAGGLAAGVAEERRHLIALRAVEPARTKIAAFLARSS